MIVRTASDSTDITQRVPGDSTDGQMRNAGFAASKGGAPGVISMGATAKGRFDGYAHLSCDVAVAALASEWSRAMW